MPGQAIIDFAMHLWASPPTALRFTCPPGVDNQSTGVMGDFDPATIRFAYTLSFFTSLLLVVAGVFLCYLAWNRSSLGRRFVMRFWMWLITTTFASSLAVWAILKSADIRALANTCESDPSAFLVPLPPMTVLSRTAAAGVWAFGAFFLLSWLLTRPWALGGMAQHWNGFFHNRGCPVPRVMP